MQIACNQAAICAMLSSLLTVCTTDIAGLASHGMASLTPCAWLCSWHDRCSNLYNDSLIVSTCRYQMRLL